MDSTSLPYKISTLVYIRNEQDQLLLLERRKHPNYGLWSCIGGKLEMGLGESPFETAIRETHEEVGLQLKESDLHLWGIFAEKNYELKTHWLMFLFECKKRIDYLPEDMEEGHFSFFSDSAIYDLKIPETDRKVIWPMYFKHRENFIHMRADCRPDQPLKFEVEEVINAQTKQ